MKIFLLPLLLVGFSAAAQNSVGVGTNNPNTSAALDVTSTSKGMLVPRMNSSQRGLIGTPATGLLVFDTDTESFWFKGGANWVELVDTSNNLLKKSGNNVYTLGTTQVGIGTSSPLYDLHIKQTNANIGLTDAATNKVSATITASDEDVIMNAYRSTTTGGNIIFQRSGFVGGNQLNAGNVGIGVPFTSVPEEKLQVNGNVRVQNSNGKIVLHDGTNAKGEVSISSNDLEIGTAAGNTTGRLLFSNAGTAKLAMLSNGDLIRMGIPGSSNLLPLAYGKISSSGTLLSSTGNFTVAKGATGVYKITLTGESNVYNNRNQYVIMVTPYNTNSISFNPMMINAGINSADNTVEVRIAKPYIYWENSSCSQSCGPFSYITQFKFYDEVDNEFSIVIYKH